MARLNSCSSNRRVRIHFTSITYQLSGIPILHGPAAVRVVCLTSMFQYFCLADGVLSVLLYQRDHQSIKSRDRFWY